MSKLVFNPSIAEIMDIGDFGYDEKDDFVFTAEEDFVGDFQITVWSSPKKRTRLHTQTVTPNANVLEWPFNPSAQGIGVGTPYYEILSIEINRVVVKGTMSIIE